MGEFILDKKFPIKVIMHDGDGKIIGEFTLHGGDSIPDNYPLDAAQEIDYNEEYYSTTCEDWDNGMWLKLNNSKIDHS